MAQQYTFSSTDIGFVWKNAPLCASLVVANRRPLPVPGQYTFNLWADGTLIAAVPFTLAPGPAPTAQPTPAASAITQNTVGRVARGTGTGRWDHEDVRT